LCQFFSVSDLLAMPVQRRPSASGPISNQSEVYLDLTYRTEMGFYQYALRDARFATDGRKLVICTNHVHGSAMVVTICKEQTGWKYCGDDQIAVHGLDAWDDICLGFTGVSFFHRINTDDSLLLSLDFPSDSRPHDFYQILNRETFRLEPNQRRMCCDIEPKRPTLAVAVTSHGNHDIIAVLTRDGRIMMFQEEQDPVELGSSNNIKASATSGLYHILEKITLEFSKDGQKLTFIDNHGQVQLFYKDSKASAAMKT